MASKKKVKELPEYFTEYCSEPYNQNHYKIVFNNGKAITFPDYVIMREFWWQHCKSKSLSHVIIVDSVQTPSNTSKKGF